MIIEILIQEWKNTYKPTRRKFRLLLYYNTNYGLLIKDDGMITQNAAFILISLP
jgi:hypothetical protein